MLLRMRSGGPIIQVATRSCLEGSMAFIFRALGLAAIQGGVREGAGKVGGNCGKGQKNGKEESYRKGRGL